MELFAFHPALKRQHTAFMLLRPALVVIVAVVLAGACLAQDPKKLS